MIAEHVKQKLRFAAQERLQDGEKVIGGVMGRGAFGSALGGVTTLDTIVVLTDRRLFTIAEGLATGRSHSWPLSDVTGVSSGTALLGRPKLTFHMVGGQDFTIHAIEGDWDGFRRRVEATLVGAKQPPRAGPASAPSPGSGDQADRLRRLAALLAEGLITQTEHDQARAAILAEL